jgi:TonB family protein
LGELPKNFDRGDCDNGSGPITVFCRILILTFVLFGSSWGQQNKPADSFVGEIASFARTGTSWWAEGSIVNKGADGKEQPPEHFRIAYQLAPKILARLEITNGPNPLLRICDGASQWTYFPNTKSYVRALLPKIGPCAYPLNAWPLLSETMPSPMFAGTDRVTFYGRPRECEVVRGKFFISAQNAVRSFITMCVDPASKLIARFQTEDISPKSRVQTFTFLSLERNAQLNPDLFQFHPPEGSNELAVIDWLDPIATPTNSAFRVSDEMEIPQLISLAAPTTRLPPNPGFSSIGVVLVAEVNADGNVQNIKVAHSLGTDLDNQALEAVKKWRFEPATKDGKPITVVTTIGVLFRRSSSR